MALRTSVLAACAAVVACVGGATAAAADIRGIVVASNALIKKANDIRTEQQNGTLSPGDGQERVAALLPGFDELERQAVALCREQTSADTLAEAADVIYHGSVLQCLYALTALDSTFPNQVGYGDVYYRLLLVPDFRPTDRPADPQIILAEFSDLPVRTEAPPWIQGDAARQLARLREAAGTLYEGDGGTATELAARLVGFSDVVSESARQFELTRTRGHLAGYLFGKLVIIEGLTVALSRLAEQPQTAGNWRRVAERFQALADRTSQQPEAMLSVLKAPEKDDMFPDFPRSLKDRLWKWWDTLFDNFNDERPKPWWQLAQSERGVSVTRRDGRLYIQGKSDGGWRPSGFWTKDRPTLHWIFTCEFAGRSDGHYMHVRVDGSNGNYVNLACGLGWQDTVFEAWRGNERIYAKAVPVAAVAERKVHQARVEYNAVDYRLQAWLDDEFIGLTTVEFGEQTSYAVYCSSGDPAEYDVWFDDFRVARFAPRAQS